MLVYLVRMWILGLAVPKYNQNSKKKIKKEKDLDGDTYEISTNSNPKYTNSKLAPRRYTHIYTAIILTVESNMPVNYSYCRIQRVIAKSEGNRVR